MNYDWLRTYQSYDATELDEEIESLKKESRNPYSSQAMGSKSYQQRSSRETAERLSAALEAKRRKRGIPHRSAQVVFDKFDQEK